MDKKALKEIESIKKELQSIIDELQNISYGVNKDFGGIGQRTCAASIRKVANHYADIKEELKHIDTSALTEKS